MKTIKARVHRLPTEEITDVLINTYINPDKHSQSPILDIPSASKVCHESNWSIETIESRGFKFQHLYITTDEEINEGDWEMHPHFGLCQRKSKPDNEGWYEIYYPKEPNTPKRGIEGRDNARKIIASTDPKLIEGEWVGDKDDFQDFKDGIPQISQSFIEEYCKAGGIDEVLVEVEYDLSTTVNTSDLVKGREYVVFEDGEQSGEGFFLEIHDKVGVCLCFDEELKDVEDYYTERKGQFFIDKTSVIIKKNPDNTIVIHPVKEKMIPLSEVKELIKKYNSDLFTAQTMELPFDGNKWIEENL